MIKNLFLRLAGVLLILFVFSTFSGMVFAQSPIFIVRLNEGSEKVFKDIRAGDIYKGELLVELMTDKIVDFKIQISSSFGNILALGGGGSVLDMATWYYFPDGEVFTIDGTEEGKQSVIIPYEIRIPESIMPADYSGILAVGVVDKAKLQNVSGAGVTFSTAIGIPFKFSVAGDRVPKLVLEDLRFLDFTKRFYEEGPKYNLLVGFKFENLGNAALRVDSDIVIKNVFGKEIVNDTYELGDIFPGAKKDTPVNFRDIGNFYGWLDLRADVFFNLVDLEGNISEERIKAGHAMIRIYSIPWIEIIIVFLFVVFVITVWFYRYYKIKALRSDSKMYTVKKEDTLQSVCSRFSIEPKKVILVNKIKRPYFLIEGQKIYIPNKKK